MSGALVVTACFLRLSFTRFPSQMTQQLTRKSDWYFPMDARKIFTIQGMYQNGTLNHVEAALALIMEGCSPEEVEFLLGINEPAKSLHEMSDQEAQELGEHLDALTDKPEVKAEDCICSAQSFSAYGCTCKKRTQPG